jgi:hypothetical protein
VKGVSSHSRWKARQKIATMATVVPLFEKRDRLCRCGIAHS